MLQDSKITIRVSEELRRDLENLAELENRTISNLVKKILKEYFEAPFKNNQITPNQQKQ